MWVKSVRLNNYRSVKDAVLECEPLTALVGANGSGKSSFLRALELFYTSAPKFTEDDFYNREVENPIEIIVTFTGLNEVAKTRFGIYLTGDDLTVARVLSLKDGKPTDKYHGVRPQHSTFGNVRSQANANDKKRVYEELRQDPIYSALPKCTKEEQVTIAMKEWETANPLLCEPQRDDGQFFGFTQVGNGYLGDFSKLIFIPAVKDAGNEASDTRGTAITELMDLVVRNAILGRADVKKFQEDIQKTYSELIDPAKLTEMSTLESELSKTLQTFVPQTSLVLKWLAAPPPEIPMPKTDLKVVEDSFPLAVGRTGHGLQRAFILTLLQHLAVAQAKSKPVSPGTEPQVPYLVLAIEEPELYQHPNRQRHFARILLQLAGGAIPGVSKSTQVLYCSHSPLMVGLDRFEQVRLLRKQDAAGKPKITRVIQAKLDDVADAIWVAAGKPNPKYTGAGIKSRLHTLLTPWMNEGFFADSIVLVEGEGDRAVILAAAKARGRDLETEDFAVIPCNGKTNLDRPQVIFSLLGVPVFTVWDSDSDKDKAKPATNRLLLALNGLPQEDWPEVVTASCACFKTNLEKTMKTEFGDEYFEGLLAELQQANEIPKREYAIKNPVVLAQLFEKAKADGKASSTIEKILDAILLLKAAPKTTV